MNRGLVSQEVHHNWSWLYFVLFFLPQNGGKCTFLWRKLVQLIKPSIPSLRRGKFIRHSTDGAVSTPCRKMDNDFATWAVRFYSGVFWQPAESSWLRSYAVSVWKIHLMNIEFRFHVLWQFWACPIFRGWGRFTPVKQVHNVPITLTWLIYAYVHLLN